MSAVRYLFDEDFNGRIVRGLHRRAPRLDAQTVQTAGLAQAPDADVLQWAAAKRRVLVSHDHRTMRARAEERLGRQLPMTGLVLVPQEYPIGRAIDDLALIAEATAANEWDGKIVFLPL
ncbi:MAG: DUF5615 family PIN-like protein [Deltaproteobacteria bacterium]|nr:DUF5615 family PIN-like protein [Deltaproteobacteria bacterium]